jgi:hypothetical protein
MGAAASLTSSIPAEDSPIEQRAADGATMYTVKVLTCGGEGGAEDGGARSAVRPGSLARLAICEDELELLEPPRKRRGGGGQVLSHSDDAAAVLCRFNYRAIPSWSITPRTFNFRVRLLLNKRLVGRRVGGSDGHGGGVSGAAVAAQLEPEPETEPETETETETEPPPPPLPPPAAANPPREVVSVRLATNQAVRVTLTCLHVPKKVVECCDTVWIL